jgi:hypothetical protein
MPTINVTVESLRKFTDDTERGSKLKEFLDVMTTADDLRRWLKSKNWRRFDRRSEELWFTVNGSPSGSSLKSAVLRQLKAEGLVEVGRNY